MLPTLLQQTIHLSRYARWRDDVGRRETWDETVARYLTFFHGFLRDTMGFDLDQDTVSRVGGEILTLGAMPSMRALMTAGKALERDHIAGYNCSYRPINTINSFDEILYILMCGTGVGFSVERQYVNKLPAVPAKLIRDPDNVIAVADSKNGWAVALRLLLTALYGGVIPSWDVSKVRPAGARLKTMGGRASGPAPLVDLFEFVVRIFEGAKGRKLTSVECHDLACKVGDCVVVGGVRRSALISLSNLSDQRMRDAKMGEWWNTAPWRRLSNNSICYTEKPEVGQFMSEWLSLYESKSGERGIFNREAARLQAMKYGRRRGYWDQNTAGDSFDECDHPIDFGTNPCSEIILRPMQFCNLTEVVARADDDFESLRRKVEVATILGTWQSCLTNFRHLGKKWKENCEEERLLGVSITGIMDCPLINGSRPKGDTAEVLHDLREYARIVNAEWASELGIPESTAITCVKPSGTVSLLVNSPAGIHTRYGRYIVRRVRMDIKDPMAQMMRDAGIPCEPEAMAPDSVLVFSFPVAAPESAITRNDRTAIEELEHWKLIQDHWCEHKPSVTINVREHEWPEVGGWVYRHFDQMSGVSFLPHSDHVYKQAPNEEITEDQFNELAEAMPVVDWEGLRMYEGDDHTTGSQELACVGGACEI